MELRNIYTFMRVAELNSFSRAAEELGYTQSAVTIQIKQLEKQLQVLLFERIGRGIRLTQAGETFLAYARRITDYAAEAVTAVSGAQQAAGKLRIGTATSIGSHILPHILPAFVQRLPQIRLQIETIQVMDMIPAVRKNQVDLLVFLDLPVYGEDLIRGVGQPLSLHFVADPSHPLAKKRTLNLEQILDQPLILTEQGLSYRNELDRFVDAQGLQMDPAIVCDNTDLIMELLGREHYISYLPDYMTSQAVQAGRLKRLAYQLPSQMQLQAVYHKNKMVTTQMQVFMELLRQWCGEGDAICSK